MESSQSPDHGVQARLLVACPHGGSGLLMRILAGSPVCMIMDERIPRRTTDLRDFLALCRPKKGSSHDNAFAIFKEEIIGHNYDGEDSLNILSILSSSGRVCPVVLVRDPIRVFDNWKSVELADARTMIDCYNTIFQLIHKTPPYDVLPLVYEKLLHDPRTEVARLCKWWTIPFSDAMLSFKKHLSLLIASTTNSEKIANSEKGYLDPITASSSTEADIPYRGLLSNTEKSHIEENLGRLYLRCWQDDIPRLRATLTEKTWFGFDLDDTLHEFRLSSGKATDKVLEDISERYGTPILALKEEYGRVLKEKTANAFSDGKTSFDYRRERFTSALTRLSLPVDQQFMNELLESYETVLMASLELKCGALDLLSTLKKMDKKIVVITEGPQDAQERTVKGLGIGGYIDFLATTNHFLVSKTSGIFPKVMEHLGISSGDIAYIGDSEPRDMEPAMAEGIFSIHIAEKEDISLNTSPPRINTLKKLQYILSDDGP
ncbi:HAD-like domain-containing protein [Hypomontagnella monticulosa]|nr:HAD-like domain-containing protein [Hypomontagnella monticulosa]